MALPVFVTVFASVSGNTLLSRAGVLLCVGFNFDRDKSLGTNSEMEGG